MAKGYVETLVTAQGDGTALTAAAAASAIPTGAKYTFPANYFEVPGKQIRIVASGRLTTVATTPGTMRFDARLGGVNVFDSQAIALVVTNGYTNVGWWIDITMTLRLIGSAGNFMGQGFFTAPNVLGGANVAMPIGGVCAMLPWNAAPAVGGNFDMAVSQQLDFFFTQTVATGSMTLHQYSVYGMN